MDMKNFLAKAMQNSTFWEREQEVLKSAFFRLLESLKSKILKIHGVTSSIYWVYYKLLVLSYMEIETCRTRVLDIQSV